MSNTSRICAVLLTLIIVMSCLTLLSVKPTSAQTDQTPNYSDYLSTPSVPVFSLKLSLPGYRETVTENETGITYHVDNNTVDITIKNQPFTSYNYSWTFKHVVQNASTTLGYDVQVRVHGSQNWTEVYGEYGGYPLQSVASDYTVISLPIGPSVTYGTPEASLTTPTYPSGELIPTYSQLDVRVRAVESGQFPPFLPLLFNAPLDFISKNSSWSNMQTITLPPSSPSPKPSPSIPEFPWLVMVAWIVSVFAFAIIILRRRKSSIFTK